jgi:hypothetical protein
MVLYAAAAPISATGSTPIAARLSISSETAPEARLGTADIAKAMQTKGFEREITAFSL